MSNDNWIRTLGFYQPFCSLMLYGKLETRWVRKGRKPPFATGEYLFYSTKKSAGDKVFDWCTVANMEAMSILKDEPTRLLNGYAIATSTLKEYRLMKPEDEEKAFVKFIGERTVKDKHGNDVVQVQIILEFENVIRIEPFEFKEGKQGVGKFDRSLLPQSPNT